MRRFPGMVAVACALLFAAGASAQTTQSKYVFVAVDAVSAQSMRLTVTGILEGQSEPVERYVSFYSAYASAFEACHRAALLAVEKPGAYRLELLRDSGTYYAGCTLVRVNP